MRSGAALGLCALAALAAGCGGAERASKQCPPGTDLVRPRQVVEVPRGYEVAAVDPAALKPYERLTVGLSQDLRRLYARVLGKKTADDGILFFVLNTKERVGSENDFAAGVTDAAKGGKVSTLRTGGGDGKLVVLANGSTIFGATAGPCAIVMVLGQERDVRFAAKALRGL